MHCCSRTPHALPFPSLDKPTATIPVAARLLKPCGKSPATSAGLETQVQLLAERSPTSSKGLGGRLHGPVQQLLAEMLQRIMLASLASRLWKIRREPAESSKVLIDETSRMCSPTPPKIKRCEHAWVTATMWWNAASHTVHRSGLLTKRKFHLVWFQLRLLKDQARAHCEA